MKKRRLWLCLLVFLMVAAAVAALLEPTRTVRGLLAGEPFHRGRPISYWREVLREYGRGGGISRETAAQFRDGHAALPVLRALADDPDRNVRWPAIALLDAGGARSEAALEVLVAALEDPDMEVRLQALNVLAGWGPMARQAVPALTARLRDPEPQVAHHADLALWRVDPSAAVTACGWQPFTSPEFGFSVMMPGEPEREERPAQGGAVAHTFQGWHRAGPHQSPTRYMVVVTDYPEGLLEGATEEERFAAMKAAAPFLTGGEVVEEDEITMGGLRGREFLLEVEGLGLLRSRHFWDGDRQYAVMAAYQPRFLNAPAADYFLGSFRLKGDPDRP